MPGSDRAFLLSYRAKRVYLHFPVMPGPDRASLLSYRGPMGISFVIPRPEGPSVSPCTGRHAGRTGFPGFWSSRRAGARRQDGIPGILVFPACWHSLARTILAVFGAGEVINFLARAILPDFGTGQADLCRRGRELGPSGHEAAGAPDAGPPLAPTMSTIPRGHRGTPQLDAHPSGANSPQLSPFALAREPVVPATRFSLRLLRPSNPTPAPGLLLKTRILGRFCRFSLDASVQNPHFGPFLTVFTGP